MPTIAFTMETPGPYDIVAVPPSILIHHAVFYTDFRAKYNILVILTKILKYKPQN